jgi:hypothetical protein
MIFEPKGRVVAVHLGHVDIEQYDVWYVAGPQLPDKILAILCFEQNSISTEASNKIGQTVSQQYMVVHQYH